MVVMNGHTDCGCGGDRAGSRGGAVDELYCLWNRLEVERQVILQAEFFVYKVSGGSTVNHWEDLQDCVLEVDLGVEVDVIVVHYVVEFRGGGDL